MLFKTLKTEDSVLFTIVRTITMLTVSISETERHRKYDFGNWCLAKFRNYLVNPKALALS